MLTIHTPDPAVAEALTSLRQIEGVGEAVVIVDDSEGADIVLNDPSASETRKLWQRIKPRELTLKRPYIDLYAELTEQAR